jgi:hypothetical protein
VLDVRVEDFENPSKTGNIWLEYHKGEAGLPFDETSGNFLDL